ncbi:hypothetical protein ACWIUD_11975, partial [Helicobacter sp. 23-1044]
MRINISLGGGGFYSRPKSAMKLLFALLIFSAFAFGQGGGGPGDGGNGHRPTGKVFRCFAKIGMAHSTAQNDNTWRGHGTYCAAPFPPQGCKKEWKWSLDYKDDSAEETAQSKLCRFKNAWEGGCRGNGGCAWNAGDCHVFVGMGHWNAPQTFSFCAIEYDTSDRNVPNDFEKVSKCVDKVEGKEVSNRKLCDDDTTGTRYYYKPKCDDTDDEKKCRERLTSYNIPYGWRFCYEPPGGGNITSFLPNQGGQTVRFREFIQEDALGWVQQRTGPCEKASYTPNSGGAPEPEPEKPDELGNLVILDEKDGNTNQIASKVHTKISGNSYNFRIFSIDSAGKFSSGISSLNCTITEKSGKSFSGAAKENSFFSALFSGKGKNFIFGEYAPESSGEASISCVGTSKDGKSVSAETTFFIAPNSYKFSTINAEFN